MGSKDKKPKTPLVASPTATGGSGTFFEAHVNASFLALVLVRAIPPVLTDCLLEEVWFQTNHLGWQTDDVLLVGKRADGMQRQYAGQVKRSFRVSQTDENCVKAFSDFWKDFNNTSLFTESVDQLGLLLLSGGDAAAPNLRSLCDCARASKDSDDFFHRLSIDGSLNAKVRKNVEIIEEIVKAVPGVAFDRAMLWRFLKSLHVQSLDLNTSTSTSEALFKSLLALSATGHDKLGEAQVTWNELVTLVTAGMPAAQAHTRNTLPEPMQKRHDPVPTAASVALTKAKEHSRTTLKGIRTVVGDATALERQDVVATLLQDIADSPLVLVTGPAGYGKSALAKLVIGHLAESSMVLAFRAEEFAVVHLDQALSQAQIPANAETLTAMLAGQARKVLLIESVERLLESSSRNAFQDLLQMCAADSAWQLILTCRDYSVDIVRSSLLEPFGAVPKILRVPPLSDEEIDAVVSAIPALARPATHPFLRELFRNPYILDKAARMQWPQDGTLPEDEHAFRKKFWRDIVRRDVQAENGMPRRRQDAFVALCLRRAKALEPFARCDDIDTEALKQLRNDSLIDFAPSTEALGTPSHDVLEDWAVLEWIAERFAVHGANRKDFVAELGSFPAIRRAYRKWLGEFLNEDENKADAYILGVVGDTELPAYFKDDTLIAVLKSESGGDFVVRNRTLLVSQQGALLRRVIHLVRVACKITPPWAKAPQPLWFVPDGPAWAAALRIVHEELGMFLPREVGLVTGLLTDWATGINWWSPVPDGAADAASIAFKLLPHVDKYDRKEQLKDIFRLILKVPKGNPDEFSKLVDRALAKDRKDYAAKQFADLVLSGTDSSFACRDVPDDVIRIAESAIISPKDEKPGRYHHAVEIDSSFGIDQHLEHEFFPVSSMQGPFSALMKYHPEKAVQFLVRLFNHAGDSYADPSINRKLGETWQEELTLPDGTKKAYHCDARLWNLYRGFSVGPHVLQCALMALEEFLLERSKSDAFKLEDWLMYLLRESNNVMAVAVAASVAIAHPLRAGKAATTLLTSKTLIQIDFARAVHEMHSPLSFPTFDVMQKLYDSERKASHQLPHRRNSLESLALQLQMTELRPEVLAIIDKYREDLPAPEEQGQEDKLWRIALHRMDIRMFQAHESHPLLETKESESGEDKAKTKRILYMPGPLDADLQKVVEEAQPGQDRFAAITSLFLWADQAFRREAGSGKDWEKQLAEAKIPPTAADTRWPGDTWAAEGPISVAAVCVRDHWAELTPEDRQWCVAKLLSAVQEDADAAGRFTSSTESVERAASVLPMVISSGVEKATEQQCLEALLIACTHPDEKVVVSAASGIGRYLGKSHSSVVQGFLGLFVRFAKRLAELYAVEDKRNWNERREHRDLVQETRAEMRLNLHWTLPCTTAELATTPTEGWFASIAYKPIMALLLPCPSEPLALQAFRQVADVLVERWVSDKDSRGDRDFHFESDCGDYLAYFAEKLPIEQALHVLDPLFKAVQQFPKEMSSFARNLASAADNAENLTSFWELWDQLANAVLNAPWITRLEERYSRDDGMLRMMFFGISWKDGVTHWHCLDGQAARVDAFFEKLPPVSATFLAYVRFLYQIGEHSLPNAFKLLEQRMRAGNAAAILMDSNVILHLEAILKRFVYGKPDSIKQDNGLRNAVLYLLDELVEAGSSVAYRMRDDFITPGSGSVGKKATE